MGGSDARPSSEGLRHRAPNPPALFVGREMELETVRERVARAPVTVVWGLGGLGKTSLVARALQRFFPRELATTLFVKVPRSTVDEDILREVLLALATTDRRSHPPTLAAADVLLEAVIDQADARGAWVVLDDVHEAPGDAVGRLFDAATRYSRAARWIATSRCDPGPVAPAEQIVRLDGMSAADMAVLARGLAPGVDDATRAVAARRARGSPWRLRQQLLGGGDPAARDAELRGVPEAAWPLLAALAHIELPLPAATVAALAPGMDAGMIDALCARSILERVGEGVCLHDVAREQVPRGPPGAVEVAELLAGAASPEAWVESIRCLRAAGDPDGAAVVAERRWREALASPQAARFAGVIHDLPDRRVDRARLSLAVHLGDPDALAAARLPAQATPFERMLHAETELLRGGLAACARAARDVGSALAGSDAPESRLLGRRALLVESACRGETGHARGALALLTRADEARGEPTSLVEINRARWRAHLGQVDRAAEALQRFAGLPPGAGGDAEEECVEAVAVLILLGRFRGTDALLRRIETTLPDGTVDVFTNRRATLTRAVLDVWTGRLDRARGALDRLRTPLSHASYLRTFWLAIDVEQRLASGNLVGIDAELERLAEESHAQGQALNLQWGRMLALRLALLRASRAPRFARELPITPIWRALVGVHALRLESRRGRGADADVPPCARRVAHGLAWMELAACERALARRRALEADRRASQALAVARDAGAVTLELEATLARCDALFASDERDALAEVAAGLERDASACGAHRFANEARFFRLLLQEAAPRAALESFAQIDAAPVARRRAAALLGRAAPLDAVDRAVLARLAPRRARFSSKKAVDAVGPADWGLDVVAEMVWLPGGRTVRLVRMPLLRRILECVAAHGGAATKEQLAVEVWGRREYHPLRDDKRIQVAVHKLRSLIEDDAKSPRRLVTAPSGYAFRAPGEFRLVRAGS